MGIINKICIALFSMFLIIGFFFRGDTSNNKGTKILDTLFCVTIGLSISTFFFLCPLNKFYLTTDSSVFLYVGKMMHQGYFPYKDLFDHKGIILYFIQYIGVLITPNSYVGIWIIELINIIITSWLMFLISGLFSKDRIVRYLAVISVVVLCGIRTYDGGNFTEEYALPWISLAIYIFLKYFKSNSFHFSDVVWIGVGFSVVLLLRVNMIAIWLAIMPIILIRMLYTRQFRDLKGCIVAFLIGVFIVFLPIIIYAVKNGLLKDMIDNYIIFNLSYASDGAESRVQNPVIASIAEGLRNLPLATVAGIISIIYHENRKLFLLNGYALTVSIFLGHMGGRFYPHYDMIILPMLICVFIYFINALYKVVSLNKKFDIHLVIPNNSILISGFVMFLVATIIFQLKWGDRIKGVFVASDDKDVICEYISENTTEKDDVLIVGNAVKYYLLENRKTQNKYFYQSPPIQISKSIYEDFLNELKRCQSDTIVILGQRSDCLRQNGNIGNVYRFLEEQYIEGTYICDSFDEFYVYQKVE